MSDLLLDETTHDLVLDGNDLDLTVGSNATKQRVKQALLAYSGEWFLDLSDGVPYYQSILIKNPSPSSIEGILQAAVMKVPGVLELLSFSLDYAALARELTVSLSIRTNEDVIDFTQVIGGS